MKIEGIFKMFKTSEIDKMNKYINSFPIAIDEDGWPMIDHKLIDNYGEKYILLYVVKVIEK